ncbi:cyclophilin-like fold protein [Variovorax sp. GT1P44]|uniref:cyclophilin-like fold protein n=1 Tax=Variovorax sp. GT1P44 TaxID=3443742 RepID=UPI003F48AD4A
MKIHLKLNGKVIPATLANNRTAREFVAMLPLTITMHDLFKREKFGPLPQAISGKGTRTQAYEIGDLVCWGPGPDLTVFYGHDGRSVSGGIHVLGKLDFGAEEFGGPDPVEVRIEVPARDIRPTCRHTRQVARSGSRPCEGSVSGYARG